MNKYPQNVPEAVLGALYGPAFLGFLVSVWRFFNIVKRGIVCAWLSSIGSLIK